MTNDITTEIECQYKFQDKEKFDGKPYCTLFGELCEDVFAELGYEICEENCQVYEDYKNLIKSKLELETQYNAVIEQNRQLQTELNEIKNDIETRNFCVTCKKENENDKLRVECEKYKNCIDDIKDELETSSHCESEECGCDDSECLKCTIKLILGKISEVENEQ